MIRRFNYTGRKRIDRSRVEIRLAGDGHGVPTFDAALALTDLGLAGHARVYVEAYYRSSWMRFPWGTVSEVRVPESRRLTDVDHVPTVYFRVLVVDETGQRGRILASIDGVRATRHGEEPGRRESILPVNPTDLGDQIWRLHFGDEPVLEVNNRIPDILSRVQHDPAFLALVYPAVVREVLLQAVLVETLPDAEPPGWQGQWLQFARSVHPGEPPSLDPEQLQDSREAVQEWIDDVVASFSRKLDVLQRYLAPSPGPEPV